MKQVILAHALSARPTAADFHIVEAPAPVCPLQGVRARVVHLSLDPYVGSRLRGRHMGEPAPRPLLDPIPGQVVAQVIESRTQDFAVGDWIHTPEGAWAEEIAVAGDHARKLDPSMAPLGLHAGVLGMPGLTAWAGITQRAQVGGGDVVLVDAAAGPVGATAGQIARIAGAKRVVGIAGGPEKCALVVERFGFDACVDHRAPDFLARLDAALPDPPSVHFENVGMSILLPALQRLAPYGRVVLCGLVEQYHADSPPPQIPAGLIIGKRAILLGLVVYDFYARFNEYVPQAAAWIKAGRLVTLEDRVEGLENAPALFERLMKGRNVGKAVVSVAPETL